MINYQFRKITESFVALLTGSNDPITCREGDGMFIWGENPKGDLYAALHNAKYAALPITVGLDAVLNNTVITEMEV